MKNDAIEAALLGIQGQLGYLRAGMTQLDAKVEQRTGDLREGMAQLDAQVEDLHKVMHDGFTEVHRTIDEFKNKTESGFVDVTGWFKFALAELSKNYEQVEGQETRLERMGIKCEGGMDTLHRRIDQCNSRIDKLEKK